MKKFNQTIQISVSVDDIAKSLLSKFDTSFPHAELLTETVIGNLMQRKHTVGLSQVYNALNGYTNEIDFEVGQEVICEDEMYTHYVDMDDNKIKSGYKKIGHCKITEIDIYRDNKVCVEYTFVNKDLTDTKDTKWVSHTNCKAYTSLV
jgi:hypothetical protein